jgi:hypothetical protein
MAWLKILSISKVTHQEVDTLFHGENDVLELFAYRYYGSFETYYTPHKKDGIPFLMECYWMQALLSPGSLY